MITPVLLGVKYMTHKADEPRTSLKFAVSVRDMANRKARAKGMTTLAWLTMVVKNAE
jgi:hypothetical protein